MHMYTCVPPRKISNTLKNSFDHDATAYLPDIAMLVADLVKSHTIVVPRTKFVHGNCFLKLTRSLQCPRDSILRHPAFVMSSNTRKNFSCVQGHSENLNSCLNSGLISCPNSCTRVTRYICVYNLPRIQFHELRLQFGDAPQFRKRRTLLSAMP